MKRVRGTGGSTVKAPSHRKIRAAAEACGLERVAYFDGRLLGTGDLVDEQSYFRTRLRRRNLLLHGAGVVTGLEVSVAPPNAAGGQRVLVEPGFAFDPRGEEIEVCRPVARPLPARGGSLIAQLTFVERPARPVPAPGSPDSSPESGSLSSRIEETFALVLAPTADAGAVAIARLAFRGGQWRVDRRFRRPRAS
jgi:hypothetical protein